MNDQKKLKLSKETLRCLDDDALTAATEGSTAGEGTTPSTATTPTAARAPASASAPSATASCAAWPSSARRTRDNMKRHEGQRMTCQPTPDGTG